MLILFFFNLIIVILCKYIAALLLGDLSNFICASDKNNTNGLNLIIDLLYNICIVWLT